jgi:hypothetical protein
VLVPGKHEAPEQQPLHSPPHTHVPFTQLSPLEQAPWHFPPHASSAPQALPAQFGVQATHAPLVPHVCPAKHATHAFPPVPHALDAVPSAHCPAEQQPVHDVVSHTHAPLAQ